MGLAIVQKQHFGLCYCRALPYLRPEIEQASPSFVTDQLLQGLEGSILSSEILFMPQVRSR